MSSQTPSSPNASATPRAQRARTIAGDAIVAIGIFVVTSTLSFEAPIAAIAAIGYFGFSLARELRGGRGVRPASRPDTQRPDAGS